MDIRQTILDTLDELLADNGVVLDAPLTNDALLLQTGLDSLGFAVLVVRLEDQLGYDPFMLMSEPVYPRTLGEFIAVYEALRDHARPE